MKNIKIERTVHRGQPVIKLLFNYDIDFVSELRKQLPDARWSRTMRCWYTPDSPETTSVLNLKFEVQDFGAATVAPLAITNAEQTLSIARSDSSEKEQALQCLLQRFAHYMTERRYSPRTVDAYTE